jgi:acyl phosphate:glycerol-3-phosphate acyltransferase
MSTLEYVPVVSIAYLIGSIPFAYLAGRVLARKDLRLVGSGNLGASNVYKEVGHAAGAAVFFADCAKAGLTLLVLRLLGAPLLAQSLAALAVIAGHNWSVFTRFKGGRGVAVILVSTCILLPYEAIIILGILAFGFFTGTLAMYCGIALCVLPLLAIGFDRPASLVLFATGAFLLGMTRRLQGSPEVSAAGAGYYGRRTVIASRLLYDREFRPEWAEEQER